MPFTPPPIPVFPAGYGALPADMGTWIQNSLGFQTTSVLFRAEMHGAQTMTSGATTTINFDTILEDPYSGWNGGTFAWTPPYTGWYNITLTAFIAPAARTIEPVIITPELTWRGSIQTTSATYAGASSAEAIEFMLGTLDTVKGAMFVSGGNGTTSTVNGKYTTMEINFVSQ